MRFLGNVLYGLGEVKGAAERFRQAVELDRDFAEAWNNLGNVLTEVGDVAAAVEAYQRAVTIAPDYADARCHLADALEQQGRLSEARGHWFAYVRLGSHGEWTDYARSRLAR
jgi:tetratricopeptide (TPR) repeat protein